MWWAETDNAGENDSKRDAADENAQIIGTLDKNLFTEKSQNNERADNHCDLKLGFKGR